MNQPTHRLRPKGASTWQHVTDEQLAAIKQQTGERQFKAGYQVEAMQKQPDPLPTTPKASATPDESPVTTQEKPEKKK